MLSPETVRRLPASRRSSAEEMVDEPSESDSVSLAPIGPGLNKVRRITYLPFDYLLYMCLLPVNVLFSHSPTVLDYEYD